MDVMANDATAKGMLIKAPMITPKEFETVHDAQEKMFTQSACLTDQLPSSNFSVFTPNDSSVTVAPNRNVNRFRSLSQNGANDAEYSI